MENEWRKIVTTPAQQTGYFIGGFPPVPTGGTVPSQLQSTIAAATSGTGSLPPGVLHHPITCQGKLHFDEEGVFSCSHFEVPADDRRTKACLVHSLALKIVEEAFYFCGMSELPYDRKEVHG